MTAPYRTSEASLRAEVERLTRELATLREWRARRWTVTAGGWSCAASNAAGAVMWAAYITREDWTTVNVAGVVVNALCWALWAFCFVRRVPADGGGE